MSIPNLIDRLKGYNSPDTSGIKRQIADDFAEAVKALETTVEMVRAACASHAMNCKCEACYWLDRTDNS